MDHSKAKAYVYLMASVVALIGSVLNVAGVPNQPLKEFKDLLSTAKTLESAEMLFSTKPTALTEQRLNLLYQFAREVKSAHSDKFFSGVTKTADEFRIQSYSYLEENKKAKNWFSFMKIGGPLNTMKSLSKNDPFLGTITERYESQAKNGKLTQGDVDCDIVRYQVRGLHEIMFILQTDIKYLVMEQQPILNSAIFEQLKANKFVSSVNFYAIHELNEKQREILLQYFADRVDASINTVGEAVDHFFNPGQYIIGRLLDSCQTVVRFEEEWKDRQKQHDDVCPNSTSDPNGRLFPVNYKFNKYNDVFAFCNNFLDAL